MRPPAILKHGLLAAAAAIACVPAGPATAACLSYAGRAHLAGVLTRQVFPGPPNYDSVARGDRPETAWVLRVSPPLCVDADTTDRDGINAAAANVTEIQLVVTPETFARHAGLVGQRVGVSGVLFGAHTGHHHTPVLLGDAAFDGTAPK